MTIKNRRKNPIRPDEIIGKFPTGTILKLLEKHGDLYLVTGTDEKSRDEAWWVDYTNAEIPFNKITDNSKLPPLRLYAN